MHIAEWSTAFSQSNEETTETGKSNTDLGNRLQRAGKIHEDWAVNRSCSSVSSLVRIDLIIVSSQDRQSIGWTQTVRHQLRS